MLSSIWGFVKSAGFMAVVALVSFVVAIYVGFYYEKQGNISIELMQPTKVLDIHQAVGGLSISYNGEELRTAKKNLWLINVTIKNTGNAVIRKGDFDDSSLLTLRVSGGEVVEKPTIITDSVYLKDNIKPRISNDSLVFNPVIIEPDEKFRVSFFVLGSENSSPVISLVGKVAGVKGFDILKMSGDSQTESFWSEVFTTSKWWYQIIRVFVYAFLCLILMALLAMSLSIPSDIISARRKNKEKSIRSVKVNDYKPEEDISLQRKTLLDFYVAGGVEKLGFADACFKIADDRKKLFLKLRNYGVNNDEFIHEIIKALCPVRYTLKSTYEEMRKKKLISDNYYVDPLYLDEFEQICEHLNVDINEFHKRKFSGKRTEMHEGYNNETLMDKLVDLNKE
ncbi:TPA: hypothetical protein G8L80_001208 [Salmonella enterica]|nr:hypothetical protein [Salmonella enterica]HAF5858964.1 hypothetical protein [Salmonella enterica]